MRPSVTVKNSGGYVVAAKSPDIDRRSSSATSTSGPGTVVGFLRMQSRQTRPGIELFYLQWCVDALPGAACLRTD